MVRSPKHQSRQNHQKQEREGKSMSNSVTHEMAVERLRAAGADIVAEEVAAFRNVDGNLGGWDGWVKGKYGHRIIGIIWPEEQTRG